MNNRIHIICAVVASSLGIAAASTVLLLPLEGDTQKSQDISTVNDLYRDAVQNAYKGTVSAPQDSAHRCGDRDCAMRLAGEAKVDEVIYSSLKRLGSKWIFSSTLMDADGSRSFNQRASAINLEDLEPVTRRVADAVVNRKTLEEVADIDNVTGKEQNSEPERRRSLAATGFSLGYLYPVGGGYKYLKMKTTYDSLGLVSSRTSSYERPYSQMIRLAWLNSWEFRRNMMLDVDLSWALPNVLGGDVNLQYLLAKTDYAPFIGGGLGIQYVTPMDDSTIENKRNSGPAFNIQGGMVLFRTYDIHVIAKAEYQVVLNSRLDNGLSVNVGVVYQKKPEDHHDGGFWSNYWYYILGALLVSSVIGAAK